MINFIFFVIFASVFGTGISILQNYQEINPAIPLAIITIGIIGMMTSIKGTIKEIQYGSEIHHSMPCRKCIWSKPVYENNRIKGYICKNNPIRYVFMKINDKHSDRKYRKTRAFK